MRMDSNRGRVLYVIWMMPFAVCLWAAFAFTVALIIGLPVLALIDLLRWLL